MSSDSVIDLPVFNALKDEMGADFIGELLQTYFEEVPQLLGQLQTALAAGDCDSFQRAAHSIKSTSNSFGALQFGLQARELEMMGKSNSLDGASDKVELLFSDFEIVRKTLEELNHA